MVCPDEDTYALLMEGRLADDRRHELESHLDQCPACATLLSEVAKIYARPSLTGEGISSTLEVQSEPADAPVLDAAVLGAFSRVQLAAALLHALIAARFWWLYSSLPGDFAGIGPIAFSYWLGWAPLGAAFALLSAWGLRRRAAWAVRVTTWYALLALPTIVFLPLSIYTLRELRRAGGRSGARLSVQLPGK